MVSVILVALRKWPERRKAWLPAHFELEERCQRKRADGRRSKRELKNWVTPDEVSHMIGQLERQVQMMHSANNATKRRVLFNFLVLRFLTDIPTLRTQNLAAKIVTREQDDPEENVLLSTDHGKSFAFLLRTFETVRSHGEQRIELPARLCKVIHHSLKLFPRRWFLSLLTDGSRGMSSNLISQLCAKIWPDKNVTPTLLRKLTVTTLMKSKPTLQQRVALSQAMLHSVQVQKSYYKKDTSTTREKPSFQCQKGKHAQLKMSKA